MRKHLNYLFAFAIALFLAGCSNESNPADIETDDEINLTEDEKFVLGVYGDGNDLKLRTVSDAEEISGRAMNNMLSTSLLKSQNDLVVDRIDIIKADIDADNKLKSDLTSSDTIAYVLNYSNNAGFALVAADKRIQQPLLAFGTNGEFDDTFMDGNKYVQENIEDYILEGIAGFESQKDALLQSAKDKLQKLSKIDGNELKASCTTDRTLDYGIIGGQFGTIVRPMSQVEWHQGDPFNRNVRYNNCTSGTTPAGCGAVGLAHILSYWKYPASINGVSFDWENLNRYTADHSFQNRNNLYKFWWGAMENTSNTTAPGQVAALMQQLGARLVMEYKCNGSGTSNTKLFNAVKGLGFNADNLQNYNVTPILGSLNSSRPVLITGVNSTGTGHIWVIDGYLIYINEHMVRYIIYDDCMGQEISNTASYSYSNSYYLHMNWGEGGKNNGYFLAGVFEADSAPIRSSGTTKSTENNFRYDNKIITNIRR